MFDILFGWRKASKCKKLIRRVQCRLKLLKNKRCSIVRQLREDVAQLLKIGHEQSAFNRADQLYKDESIMAVYEMLDHFCEFIILHLSYIRRNKDCPNDINEAVSSLIFASARCGDIPELRAIRKLFGERYGQKFAMAAVELFPGNLVNRQIKEKLSIKSVPDDVKHELVDEIFRENCLHPGPLALEYTSEWQQQQVKEIGRDQALDRDLHSYFDRAKGSQIQDSDVKEIEGKTIYIDSSLTEEFHSRGASDITSTTASSTVLQPSPKEADSPVHKKADRKENYAQLASPYEITVSGLSTIVNQRSGRVYSTILNHEEERVTALSSSESSSQFPEETVYYLDDVEEFQSPMSKQRNYQDQRLFVFKSCVPPKVGDHRNEGYKEQYDSGIEKAGLRLSRKSEKASGKRLRKRSLSREKQYMKDVNRVIYYGESCLSSPNQNRKSYHHRKCPKKTRIEESQQSYHAEKRSKQPCYMGLGSDIRAIKCRHDQMKLCCSCSLKCETVIDCSLENPCYFCTREAKDELDWEQERRITAFVGLPKHDLQQEKWQDSFSNGNPNNPRRNYGNGAETCDVLSFPNHLPNKQSKRTEREAERPENSSTLASSNGCSSNVTSPRARKESESPYLRAMTMPPERPKEIQIDSMLRSNSFPFQQLNQLNHVHPKLPDYDELAAKFNALKKAYLQNEHL